VIEISDTTIPGRSSEGMQNSGTQQQQGKTIFILFVFVRNMNLQLFFVNLTLFFCFMIYSFMIASETDS
jgi:hypothetical protein